MLSRRPVRYAEKIDRKKKRTRIFINIAILIALCALLRSFVFQTWHVRDDSMLPSLHEGDIVLVIPYFFRVRGVPEGIAGSAGVGNVVLVSDGSEYIVSPRQQVLDAVVRFLTFQRYSILRREFGDSFSSPSFMRIRSREEASAGKRGSLVYILSSDRQRSDSREVAVRRVAAERIEGRAVFRIWPLSAMSPLR